MIIRVFRADGTTPFYSLSVGSVATELGSLVLERNENGYLDQRCVLPGDIDLGNSIVAYQAQDANRQIRRDGVPVQYSRM